ncbi:glyoxalase domain-containing protein 4-like isoform X1 [Eriocheir sinensis]|uniref:glyoxalase domain-containing protein 4-like isoform X1 n=2 Tax=Eriocheir sinensis TaxID=95602 RepID=UPI0021C84657|nr:glyoxalase domain-containing protein 4-like isoform X1 [Eriocheir sinensis]
MASRRALHFVYKIGDRKETAKFYRDILGMKVLRHEEFDEGCKAACNGPYDGKWSKTMIGYGPEDNHFVCELTYNYGVSQYEMGNDFLGMHIDSQEAVERAQKSGWPVKEEGNHSVLEAPGGYKFIISHKPQPADKDPVQQVVLASSNLEKSVAYWKDLAGMTLYSRTDKSATLGYSDTQAKLVLQDIGGPVNHAKAFGRIAFSAPGGDLPGIEKKMKEDDQTILTPYISLDTPGKATVQVVILADPDGHEICFVGDEGFRELSQVDPKGDELLTEAMEQDKSDEWFAEKGGKAAA